jgi:hypothetical protein
MRWCCFRRRSIAPKFRREDDHDSGCSPDMCGVELYRTSLGEFSVHIKNTIHFLFTCMTLTAVMLDCQPF